jgi:hypothetical protein
VSWRSAPCVTVTAWVAAGRTGLDPALLKKMLPMLAMLVSAYLAKGSSPGAAGGSPASWAARLEAARH